MKGVIYARYSSDNQREESIDGQLRENMAYAAKNGIEIVGTYIDRAYSAKTDNRPEFQRMIKDSGKKAFDVVIVWKLDRFSRNRFDSAYYKAQLKKSGVKVISATESISQGPEGILMESVLEGFAEYFSAELAEKVSRGMVENALKGKYNGGNVPLGYRVDAEQHFQIDPLTAPAVLEMFQRYADGATMHQIVQEMNAMGVRSNRGNPLTINSVTRTLQNRKYIGEYRFQNVVQPDCIPAIVPQELFDRVQVRMQTNQKAPAKHKAEEEYLLTTKLYCGHCERMMVGESGTSKTGQTHRYYKCVGVKKHMGCDKKSVKKEWIEDLVIEHIRRIILDDAVIEKLAQCIMEELKRENNTLVILQRQQAEVQKSIDNLIRALEMGIFTTSTRERLEELEKQKKELSLQIAREELARPALEKEQIIFWLYHFRDMDINKLEHRRRLINSFVNSIILYDDHLVFIGNYKDGTQTISFAEIEAAGLGSDLKALGVPIIKGRQAPPFYYWYAERKDSKGRPERSEGKKVSGGHFFSPWESPNKQDGIL